MHKQQTILFITMLVLVLGFMAVPTMAIPDVVSSCEEGSSFSACVGTQDACDTYGEAGICTDAGCDWITPDPVTTKMWGENFANSADWNLGNSFATAHSSSNCINDGNDKCLKIKDVDINSAATFKNKIDLSACAPGSAVLNIAKIKTNSAGDFEPEDCVYVKFSADNGANWDDQTLIFCDANPSPTFQTSIPDSYLTDSMRLRVREVEFKGNKENAFLDGFSISCDVPANSCEGQADSCESYGEETCMEHDGCRLLCEEPKPEEATIVAHKIVCDDEASLPNWGKGGSAITKNTAEDWVEEHEGCELVRDWNFEWAPMGTPNPGDDFYGTAGGAWTTFGPTDGDGMATTTVPLPEGENKKIWMREVIQEGYIPFTYTTNGNTNVDDYSAEFYCHTDVLNYDNYDRVDNMESDGTYYCVAWNVAAYCGNDHLDAGEECDGQEGLEEGQYCTDKCEIVTPTCTLDEELIENGGFETPIPDGKTWDIFASIDGWSVEWAKDEPDYHGYPQPEEAYFELHNGVKPAWTAAEGRQYAELDTDWNDHEGKLNGEPASTMIYQDIPTEVGKEYTVRFSFSPRPGTGTDNAVELWIDWDLKYSTSADGGSDANAATVWTEHEYTFRAMNPTTRIALKDVGEPSNSLGTFIDAVSTMCTPACGDGVINQEWEECDGEGEYEAGWYCSDDCQLLHEPFTCEIEAQRETTGLLHLDVETEDESELFIIDPTTGIGSLYANYDYQFFPAVSVASDGTIYSVTRSANGKNTKDLVILNNNNTYTVVGATGIKKNVVAMEFAPDGTLYAGTAKKDKIYTIDPNTGLGTLFYKPNFDIDGGDLVVTPHRELVYVRTNGAVWVLDLDTMTEYKAGKLPKGYYTSAAWYKGEIYAYDRTYDALHKFTIDPFVKTLVDSEVGPFHTGDGSACPGPCDEDVVIVSDEQTMIGETPAVPTWVHPVWTDIDGATWIWESELVNDPSVDEYVTFNRTFELDGMPTSAWLEVAADNTYTVWVNGVLLDEQLDERNFDHTEVYDVSDLLYFGENTLTFEVMNIALGTNPKANPAGLIFRLDAKTDLCEDLPVCGDNVVNQLTEECDGDAPEGYECIECVLEEICVPAFVEAEYPATWVEAYSQGLQANGNPVKPARSVPEQGLELESNHQETDFFSLGFGGSLTVEFEYPAQNEDGDDIAVYEDTWGPYALETAEVWASEDCEAWTYLGDASNNLDVPHSRNTFDLGQLEFAKCVRVVDTTNPELFSGSADSFDVNGIHALHDYEVICPGDLNPALELNITDREDNGVWFECIPSDYDPDDFDWDFDDNATIVNGSSTAYHEFGTNGEYMVTCAAGGLEASVQVVMDACDVYALDFSHTVPPEICINDVFDVYGTLYLEGDASVDFSGKTVSVNSVNKLVFGNDWSAQFDAAALGPMLITAETSNVCGETFMDETYVMVNECTPASPGGGCKDGYHQVGEACVKNPVKAAPPQNPVQKPSTEPSGEGEDGGNSTDSGKGEEGDGGNAITGGVTGFTLGNAWPWLLALLGLILVLFGASWFFKKN